jgi:histidine triad (HIT) family protein
MKNCVFCDKLRDETFDPAYQFSNCVAFEPLNPVTPGHLLVVPRQHAANVNELSGQAIEDVGYALRYFTNDIESYNIITSKGPEATQTVFHLHWHIVPRSKNDGLKLPWTDQQEGDNG